MGGLPRDGAAIADDAAARVLADFDRLRGASDFPVRRLMFVSDREEHVERLQRLLDERPLGAAAGTDLLDPQ
jgi:hypothetical protein